MSFRKDCGPCHGAGYYGGISQDTCTVCRGMGILFLDGVSSEYKQCGPCHGSGYYGGISSDTCTVCSGLGLVRLRPPSPTGSPPPQIPVASIEIHDPELRKRCLDLFTQFQRDGHHDRLDTVVNEATRILEDRLRSLSNALPTCVGVDLAKHASAPPSPYLTVSPILPEQEAAHLLFRGVFGFIRNSVHHRLVGTLQPERVLQIVGMVDYLIWVAEAAGRDKENV
jgi:hypothetical protein